MTPEERMLERFTRERQRTSRGAAFNLEDTDELTHYGQSLSKLDDFDNVGLGLEDEDEEEGAGQIDSRTVQRAHFGGFGDEEGDEEDGKGRLTNEKGQWDVHDGVWGVLDLVFPKPGIFIAFCDGCVHCRD